MICHSPSKQDSYELLVDGVSMQFAYAPNGIKVSTLPFVHCSSLTEQLGDYGHFPTPEYFCREGNLFTDLSLMANITPTQHKISERGGHQRENSIVRAYHYPDGFTELYTPLGLSLPRNDDFKSLLISVSTRFTNRYLVTWVIQCPHDHCHSSIITRCCNIAKPFVWHRNENAGPVIGRAGMAR